MLIELQEVYNKLKKWKEGVMSLSEREVLELKEFLKKIIR